MPIVLYALPREHFLVWWELELHAQLTQAAGSSAAYAPLYFKYR